MQKSHYRLGWVFISAGSLTLLLFTLHSAIVGLIVAVDSNQLATVLVGYVACLLIGGVVTLSLIALGRKFSPQIITATPPRREFLTLANATSASPQNAFVRNVIDPMQAPPKRNTLEFRVSNSDGILEAKTIPRHYVERFLSCPTPKRGEWKGSVTTYSDLLRIAKSYGWVTDRTDGENGVTWSWEWKDPIKRINRLEAHLG